MVLHQEPNKGVIPDVYWKKAREEGEPVMGSYQSIEQIRGYRDGALEACAPWPRWVAGLPYLLPPSGHPIGGEKAADVGVLRPDGSRLRVARGVAEG